MHENKYCLNQLVENVTNQAITVEDRHLVISTIAIVYLVQFLLSLFQIYVKYNSEKD